MAKKHGHEAKHAHCEHCLHACDHCEVAYCCDCNKEWGACRRQHGYGWNYRYLTTIPCDSTTTWGGTVGNDTTLTSGSNAVINADNEINSAAVSDYSPTHAHAHVN